MTALYIALALFTLAVCVFADPLGRRLGVVDRPDGVRKLHGRETPLVGGLAAILPVMVMAGYQAATTPFLPFYGVLAVALAGFLLLGFIDDRSHIRPMARLVVSVAAGFAMIETVPALEVSYLYFGFLDNAIYLNRLGALVFTLFCLVGLQNAINMADGENGLATGLAMLWTVFLAVYAPAHLTPVLVTLIAGLAVVFGFNIPGRLFLGDSGTYAISIAMGILAIYVYEAAFPALRADVVALWFLVPIVDCLRLMAARGLAGKSPLSSDRNHFHHRLQRLVAWPGSLAVYLGLVGVPGGLAYAYPDKTSLWAVATLLVYGFVLILSSRGQRHGAFASKRGSKQSIGL